MIIGIAGVARSGKDTVADHLVKNYEFVKVNLADPIKRAAQAWYGFTDEQVWGQDKDKPDERYPVGVRGLVGERVIYRRGPKGHLHEHHGTIREMLLENRKHPMAHVLFDGDYDVLVACSLENLDLEQPFLTPRHAFQIIGTEVGRLIYPDTWTRLAVSTAKKLLAGGCRYNQREGLVPGYPSVKGVVIADVRWPAGNEGQAIRAAGGQLWWVQGRGGLEGQAAQHTSEKGLDCPDSTFQRLISNTSTIEVLHAQVDRLMRIEELKKEVQRDIDQGNLRPYDDA